MGTSRTAEIVKKLAPTTSLLDPKVVGEMLSVKTTTLANWRHTNAVVLPYVKVGHGVRYRREDVERFINDNLRNAQEA